jgi:hypothetical protein
MQGILEMLVEDIDHAVAESPEQKQGRDEHEGHEQVFSIGRFEHLRRFHTASSSS